MWDSFWEPIDPVAQDARGSLEPCGASDYSTGVGSRRVGRLGVFDELAKSFLCASGNLAHPRPLWTNPGVGGRPEGAWVNKVMVLTGYAWWFERYAPDADQLRAAQEAASQAKRGLWGEADAVAPWLWRKGVRKV